MLKYGTEAMVFTSVVICQDLIQGVLYGVIKALARQKCAAYINFVTFYVVTIPLSLYFGFRYDSHLDDDNKIV